MRSTSKLTSWIWLPVVDDDDDDDDAVIIMIFVSQTSSSWTLLSVLAFANLILNPDVVLDLLCAVQTGEREKTR